MVFLQPARAETSPPDDIYTSQPNPIIPYHQHPKGGRGQNVCCAKGRRKRTLNLYSPLSSFEMVTGSRLATTMSRLSSVSVAMAESFELGGGMREMWSTAGRLEHAETRKEWPPARAASARADSVMDISLSFTMPTRAIIPGEQGRT
jgi:hypothetical protein